MRAEKQPNRWSCMPTAFAMVMGIPVKELIAKIGHNGSEILWPELGEPRCRKSFHLQEVLFAARKLGKRFTVWESAPASTPDGRQMHHYSHHIYVRRIMQTSTGVVFGQGQRHPHCWAWDGVDFLDPSDVSNQVKHVDLYAELI